MLRPQDTATRERKNLNGLWRFALDPDSEGTAADGRWAAAGSIRNGGTGQLQRHCRRCRGP